MFLLAISAGFGAALLANDPTRELIVAFRPTTATVHEVSTAWPASSRAMDRIAARLGLRIVDRMALDDPSRADETYVLLLEAEDAAAADSARATLEREPAVAWVERHATREPALWWLQRPPGHSALEPDSLAFPDDPLFRDGRQWGLENRGDAAGSMPGADIRARAAWSSSVGSPDVILAFADTGIDPDHPEFADRLADGSPRLLPGINVADGGNDVRDLYGHGTPVTGIAVASTNDGVHFDSLGIAGVCGGDGRGGVGARILPIKITSGAAGVSGSFWIAQAVMHAVRAGARAVNLSFAGSSPSTLERQALQQAILHGCVVVAASGNRGFRDGEAPQYPAAYAAEGLCLQVGASDPADRRAAFSSYGPGLDLLAPGEGVWTTFMTYPSAAGGRHPGYVAAAGTSFAAPFATGAIGLLASLRPELIDTDFQNLLRRGAQDLGPPGLDARTGAGRLDVAAALGRVRPEIGIWHDEVAATSFREVRSDTLRVTEAGIGAFDHPRLVRPAALIEVLATVAVPDSFVDSIEVWPRVGGTTTLRGDFMLPYVTPWAQVVGVEPGRFTLRGYFYRADSSGSAAGADEFLPLPVDQARFGFTVIGRVHRLRTHVPVPPLAALRAWPNPFTGFVRLAGLESQGAVVFDLAGRRVRRLRVAADGTSIWDGRDESGASVAAGFYWVTLRAGAHRQALRVLKLR